MKISTCDCVGQVVFVLDVRKCVSEFLEMLDRDTLIEQSGFIIAYR